MPATGAAQPSNPFIKQLASSDRRIRDRALASLRTYLHRSTPFSDLDFLKLWKGLFFCMWMSDKPLNQQRLARDLAGLVDVLQGRANFLGFVAAFWKTMAREWGGIEALRMDKFMYLVRCYVNKGFEVVSKSRWADKELLKDYLAALESIPLDTRDPKIPNGLRFHVIDIYVDELDKVDTHRDAPLEEVLAPLRRLGKESLTKVVRTRVEEALDDDRLEDWSGEREEAGQEKTIDPTDDPHGRDAAMGSDDSDFGGFDE